jgi:hypothetical protein
MEIENEKKKPFPPGWANFRPIPTASLSPRVRSPSPLGPPPACNLVRASPLRVRASIAAARPHLPAALTLALSRPRIADKPAPPVSHPISLAAHGFNAITAGHRPLLLPACTRRTEKFDTASSSLAVVASLHGTAPPSGPVVAAVHHLHRLLCTSPPPNTAAPLPSGAYKRAAPSSSMPCTSLATLLPNSRAQLLQLRRPSLRSGELFLLPPPLWLFSEQFTRISNFTTSPQTLNNAPLPPITTQTSPTTTPAAELRHPTVVSSLPVTSGKIGPTLKLASLSSCYGTYPIPRNRVTDGETPLNQPAARFSPRIGRFTPSPSAADVVSPPALPGAWARNRHHLLACPRCLSPLGRAGPAFSRPHPAGPEFSPPRPTRAENPFPFLFPI